MKKAKVILTAIVVLTIVGGVFAFKAKDPTKKFYCTTANSPVCTFEVTGLTTVDQGIGTFKNTECYTTSTDVECPQTTIYSIL